MPANKTIDLHVHSTYSDGRLDPTALVARALHNNVVALAVTDHDTLKGVDANADACRRAGIEFIPGVELSCAHLDKETHILSLYADPLSKCRLRLEELRIARRERMRLMLERLRKFGMDVDFADLPADDGAVGRPHLARAMLAKGFVKSVSEAFGRYLYDNGPVYMPKLRLSAEEGIDLAKKLGGVSVLAHPGPSGLIQHLNDFTAMGIDAVEVYHPKHGGETTARLLRYCRDNRLLVSGGSDFHAPGESPDVGSLKIPLDILDPLRERAAASALRGCS